MNVLPSGLPSTWIRATRVRVWSDDTGYRRSEEDLLRDAVVTTRVEPSWSRVVEISSIGGKSRGRKRRENKRGTVVGLSSLLPDCVEGVRRSDGHVDRLRR